MSTIGSRTELPTTPAAGDSFAVEHSGKTYKIDYSALASAIIAKLGDPVGIVHGGSGGTTAEEARYNLGITPANIGALPQRPTSIELFPTVGANGGFIDFHHSGQDVDYTSRIIELVEGILHITGGLTLGMALGISSGGTGATSAYNAAENLGLSLAFNDTWTLADMYTKMVKVPVPGSAMLWLSPTAVGAISGDKINAYCTVIASRTNAGNWRFLAFTGTAEVFTWRLDDWSSASATPTIGTVYRLAGTAI